MFLATVLVVLGIGLLVVGGELLLRGSVGLATLAKLSPAVIGLTVVAAGTSVPELAVSSIAAYQGSNEIAVANVVGSNIFNVTMIIGLCALIRPFPVSSETLRLEYPVLAIVTLVSWYVLADLHFGRVEGLMFILAYIGFTVFLVVRVRKQMSKRDELVLQKEVEEIEPIKVPSLLICMLLIVVGITLLGLGAQSTVAGASQLARFWGWSERLIGLTIVSAGTSLPEVVASLVSGLRGRSDVALSNVIGSNIFNLLAILGLSALVSPMSYESSISSDFVWMMFVTLALMPVLWNGRKVYRWEGAALLTIYGVYLGLLLNK